MDPEEARLLEWIIPDLVIGSVVHGVLNKKSNSAKSTASADRAHEMEAKRQQSETEYKQKIATWRRSWEPSLNRANWIPAGTAGRILARYPAPLREKPTTQGAFYGAKTVTLTDLNAEFDALNKTHLEQQKVRLKTFFDTIEKNPLTDEQITACICMDDNVQIVAAAGSGKTSTMVAKAGYTLREGLATGDEILLLAFNADAAKELGERCRDRLVGLDGAEKITCKTFHSFGLEVIAKATGKKPRTAPWLDQAEGDLKMIMTIIDELSQKDR